MKDEAKTREHLLKAIVGLRQGIAKLEASDKQRRQLEEELALVDEVARIITSTLDIDQVYEKFSLELKKLVEFDREGINIMDQDTGDLTLRYFYGPNQGGRPLGSTIPLAGSLSQEVISTCRTIRREDFAKNPRFPADVDAAATGLRSGIMVPLISKGQAIGAMGFRSRRVGAYGTREQVILERLASQIAPAVENSLVYKQAKKEMALVDEVAGIFTSTLDIGEVYQQFAAQVKKLVEFDRFNINVLDHTTGTYVKKYVVGVNSGRHVGDTIFGGQLQHVVATGHTLVRPDLAEDLRFPLDADHLAAGLRSCIALPLISKGRVTGVLVLRSRRPGAYGPRDQAILERLVNQITPAIENSRLYDRTLRSEEALRESAERIREQANALMQTNAELTKVSQAKSEFLAHMSHDLRTPLNTALGFARLLTEPTYGKLNVKQQRFSDNIITSCSHLLQLINDIIDVSKIEAGKMELEVSRVNVRECLSSCYRVVSGMAANKEISLNAKYPPKDTVILGDENKIKQIMLNLLSNAVKFTPEGGKVTVRGSIAKDDLLITVTDTGIGIDPQYQEQIFGLFDQGAPAVARKYGGSGLGLPLVKELVELHGGRLWLKSAVGKGSTFTVSLPLAPARQPGGEEGDGEGNPAS